MEYFYHTVSVFHQMAFDFQKIQAVLRGSESSRVLDECQVHYNEGLDLGTGILRTRMPD